MSHNDSIKLGLIQNKGGKRTRLNFVSFDMRTHSFEQLPPDLILLLYCR